MIATAIDIELRDGSVHRLTYPDRAQAGRALGAVLTVGFHALVEGAVLFFSHRAVRQAALRPA